MLNLRHKQEWRSWRYLTVLEWCDLSGRQKGKRARFTDQERIIIIIIITDAEIKVTLSQ